MQLHKGAPLRLTLSGLPCVRQLHLTRVDDVELQQQRDEPTSPSVREPTSPSVGRGGLDATPVHEGGSGVMAGDLSESGDLREDGVWSRGRVEAR